MFFILCYVLFLVRLLEKFDIDRSWEWKGSILFKRWWANALKCTLLHVAISEFVSHCIYPVFPKVMPHFFKCRQFCTRRGLNFVLFFVCLFKRPSSRYTFRNSIHRSCRRVQLVTSAPTILSWTDAVGNHRDLRAVWLLKLQLGRDPTRGPGAPRADSYPGHGGRCYARTVCWDGGLPDDRMYCR